MAQERVLDPEAIEEYRQFLTGLIDVLEGQVVPVLSEGTLTRAPAFGAAPGTESAAEQYLAFYTATWTNLQYLRGTLRGMESALAAVAAGGGDAESEAAVAFTSVESVLEPGAEGAAGEDTVVEGMVVEGTDFESTVVESMAFGGAAPAAEGVVVDGTGAVAEA